MLPPNQGNPGQPMGGPPMMGPQSPPQGAPMEGGEGGEPSREQVLMELKSVMKNIKQVADKFGISMTEIMSEGEASAPTSKPMPPPPMG